MYLPLAMLWRKSTSSTPFLQILYFVQNSLFNPYPTSLPLSHIKNHFKSFSQISVLPFLCSIFFHKFFSNYSCLLLIFLPLLLLKIYHIMSLEVFSMIFHISTIEDELIALELANWGPNCFCGFISFRVANVFTRDGKTDFGNVLTHYFFIFYFFCLLPLFLQPFSSFHESF